MPIVTASVTILSPYAKLLVQLSIFCGHAYVTLAEGVVVAVFHWLSEYNYDFALATIPVQIILMGYYLSRRNLPSRQSRAFAAVLAANLAMTISDIVSCEMNEIWEQFPLWLMYVVNILYFLGFLLRGWAIFYYAVEALHAERVLGIRVINALCVPILIMVALVVTTPWFGLIFHFDPGEGYHNTWLYPSIYWSTWFYIGALLFVLVTCQRRSQLRLVISLYVCDAILVAAILMRGLFSHTLVTSFFSLLAILVIYLTAQNPDLFHHPKVPLFNYGAFDEMVSNCQIRAERFSVFGIQLRNYAVAKRIYGVPQVDRGIVLIGDWLHHQFPQYYGFYIGSGRFVLLCEGGEMDARRLSSEIRQRFRRPWLDTSTEVDFTVAMAYLPPSVDKTNIVVVRECLVRALMEAELRGEDLFTINDSYLEALIREAAVEGAVMSALRERRIEVFFQPIYSVRDRQITGAEALARLNDPEMGSVPPSDFVAVAERNGSIRELGRQVFAGACLFASTHDLRALGIERINVNLSPAQCMSENLAEELIQEAARRNVLLSDFCFEITESAMDDLTLLRSQMLRLIGKGATFALDDFGSGTSNIVRLSTLPISEVKLDAETTRAFFKGESQVLRFQIDMLEHMGFDVVVEGVETMHMASDVLNMGVEYEQGFYFSPALPVREFTDYLKRTMDEGPAPVGTSPAPAPDSA